MRKLLSIVGARPQFIKASALSREWLRKDYGIHEELLHTGQHHDDAMSAVFFRDLGMAPPRHQLTVHSQHVAARMGEMMTGIAGVVEQVQPDAMLVYGDTDSTWAGAWVASRWGVPLAHVEAGLRSFDRTMPEEVNRVLTDHLARWRFCPTDEAVRNLDREGVQSGVVRTGDLQWDTAQWMADQMEPVLDTNGVLLTLHRPANVDDPTRLHAWIESIAALGQEVHFPVHPRTALVCEKIWGKDWKGVMQSRGFQLCGPLGYRDLIARLRSVRGVITDSGGLQKEAYGFQKPCIVARPVTEWVELVAVGAAHLCPEPKDMAAAWHWVESAVCAPLGLYGDGDSARQVAEALSASSWQ